MKTKTLYTRDAEKAGISRSQNFHRTGGYNVSSEPEIYYNTAH